MGVVNSTELFLWKLLSHVIPLMPSGNIIAAKELLLLMLIEHDLATFLVCFRSRGGRTVDCVRSNFTLLIVLPVLVGVVVCVESNID